jgi:para-nitrobenzyl esterase
VSREEEVKAYFTAQTYPAFIKAAYGAEFDDPHAPDVNQVGSTTFDPGAAHASDLPYLFDLLGKSHLRAGSQQSLGTTMIGYWTSFARTGTPSAAGEPAWPQLTGNSGPTLQLNPRGITTVDVAAEHHCGFWQTIKPAG